MNKRKLFHSLIYSNDQLITKQTPNTSQNSEQIFEKLYIIIKIKVLKVYHGLIFRLIINKYNSFLEIKISTVKTKIR